MDGDIELKKGIFILKGRNGAGKTNFMESIYFLCKGRSFRERKVDNVIKKGRNFLRLEGKIGETLNELYLDLQRKVIKVNKKKVRRFSDYYGRYGVIVFTHRDVDFIFNPERMRFFFNSLIASFYPDYIEELSLYSKLLKHRNSALRKKMRRVIDSIDKRFIPVANSIYRRRVNFLKSFNKFIHYYNPHIEIEYIKRWDNLHRELKEHLPLDMKYGYTGIGPHRDMYTIKERSIPVNMLSTGERTMVLIYLKMAEVNMYNRLKGTTPILMVDEVMGFLDREKRKYLEDSFSIADQVFITGDFNSGREIYIDEGKVFAH